MGYDTVLSLHKEKATCILFQVVGHWTSYKFSAINTSPLVTTLINGSWKLIPVFKLLISHLSCDDNIRSYIYEPRILYNKTTELIWN